MKIFGLLLSFLIITSPSPARLLAEYIEGEAGELSLTSQTAVGAVIMNRCRDPRFPDSVTDNAASLGIMPALPSDMAVYASSLVLSGIDPTGGATVFFHSAESSEYDGYVILMRDGDLYFAIK